MGGLGCMRRGGPSMLVSHSAACARSVPQQACCAHLALLAAAGRQPGRPGNPVQRTAPCRLESARYTKRPGLHAAGRKHPNWLGRVGPMDPPVERASPSPGAAQHLWLLPVGRLAPLPVQGRQCQGRSPGYRYIGGMCACCSQGGRGAAATTRMRAARAAERSRARHAACRKPV